MFPHRRLPYHITVLYVFASVNLMALFHVALVEAEVIVISPENRTMIIIADLPAEFGPSPPIEGLLGFLIKANPYNACAPIESPPKLNETNLKWFVLIQRTFKECSFDFKVKMAQDAKFDAAIVHNVRSEDLLRMSKKYDYDIHIPSVFIGYSDGIKIGDKYAYPKRFLVQINPDYPYLDIDKYIVPFATVIGMCFIITLVILLTKFIRDHRRRCRNRLSSQNLKKIPIKKFKKGDANDVCAICLDEYNDGDKLRVLPCSHAYHTKCIDPWLTNNKRNCPVCKRKVVLGDESSDNDSDEENENQPSETTPLLTQQPRNAYSGVTPMIETASQSQVSETDNPSQLSQPQNDTLSLSSENSDTNTARPSTTENGSSSLPANPESEHGNVTESTPEAEAQTSQQSNKDVDGIETPVSVHSNTSTQSKPQTENSNPVV